MKRSYKCKQLANTQNVTARFGKRSSIIRDNDCANNLEYTLEKNN